MKNQLSLDEVIEIVFQYAKEHKRATDTVNGRKNIELWVKAHLFDKSKTKKLFYE